MDAQAGIYLTRGDASQNLLAESLIMDREHEFSNTALDEYSVPDNIYPFSSHVHRNLVTNGGETETYVGQSTIHPFKSDQEPLNIQAIGIRVDHDHSGTRPRSDSNSATPSANFREVIRPMLKIHGFESLSPVRSECAVVPAGGFTSLTNIDDSETHTGAYPQELPLCAAGTASPATSPRGGREADPIDRPNCIRMPHTEMHHICSAGLARPTDEGETREDFDDTCEELPSSLPPSSSPPQLFSSSPYASSQSSANGSGAEPLKTVLSVGAEGCARSQDRPDVDYVVSVAQPEPECKGLHIEGGPRSSKKRIAYQTDPGEMYEPQLIKRPKLDSDFYPPPTPKRATLASQNHQFKKLSAPFRPPLKLFVTGELTRAMNKEADPTISVASEMNHDKIEINGSTMHLPLRPGALNTSRPVTQFKSPLINKILPADSRTIRLTPALQTLERKLQLLKRAIKVREDKEEEILARLATKWIEAGREVAYNVWDATKDAGNCKMKGTFIRRPYWENTDDGNMPWGRDDKPGNPDKEFCDVNSSVAPWGAGRLTPEDDNEVGCDTVGTMLRQLGIAPEIFGWDDDKEAFSD